MTELRSRRSRIGVRAIVGLLLAIFVTGTLAAASSAATNASSPRRGALHVTKECSEYTGQADSWCTITSSNLKAIKVGSRVVYLQAAGPTSLDSDIVLVVGRGNYALGHVTLDFTTGTGEVTIWGGIGHFQDFDATATVSHLDGVNWAWDGKYHFDRQDD
jgi:hypothetical protein